MTPSAEALRADGSYEFRVSLSAVALRGSVLQQQAAEFQQMMGPTARASLATKPSIAEIWKGLGEPGSRIATADAVTLGDSWLGEAIAQGRLQPIKDAQRYRWWNRLPPCWHSVLQRAPDGRESSTKDAEVWGAPYRWGCTMVAFRSDKLEGAAGGRPVTDWPDLLQPALAGKVAFVESPRELLGVALKASRLGGGKVGYNTDAASLKAAGVRESDVRNALSDLLKQVKVYSKTEHTRSVLAEDCWAVVGWSEDLTKLAMRYSNLTLVVPSSGTALWADCWAVPRTANGGTQEAGASPLLPLWLDYGLQPSRTEEAKGLRKGSASPMLLPASAASRPGAPQGSGEGGGKQKAARAINLDPETYMPSLDALERSEFLLPLDKDTKELFSRVLKPIAAEDEIGRDNSHQED